MAGKLIRGVEFVVTDADWGAIAVIRPISRWQPRTMPPWAEDKYWFVVVGLDSASGLAVTERGLVDHHQHPRVRESRILVEGERLIGTIEGGPSGPSRL